ncbi:hypothetical protein EJ08DRAFT_654091 [Tothia fuscella]|uniref:Uncharacterized protein n=1 Tax=Tothia fuscella TaxID=1048955 RepID=A0A9P4NFK5_9PEZI|nr:hypothetical protein EJ08DRAFT_654091 [Tothia fuscella]
MSSATSLSSRHYNGATSTPRHLVALFLSLSFFPISFLLALFYWLADQVRRIATLGNLKRPLKPRVLITGEDHVTTINFARLASSAGYEVHVADWEPIPFTNPLRHSNAVSHFHVLPFSRSSTSIGAIAARVYPFKRPQSAQSLPEVILRLIRTQNIEIWIPCEAENVSNSSILTAKEVVRRQKICHVLGPSLEITRLSKDGSAFVEYVKRIDSNIQCPRDTTVTSRAMIHKILANASEGQKFQLEKTLVSRNFRDSDSSSGFSGTTLDEVEEIVPLTKEYITLPLPSSNGTYDTVASMLISQDQPWTMQEMYTCKKIEVSCLVVNCKVRAIIGRVSMEQQASTTNVETLDPEEHKEHIDPTSPIGVSLLEFATQFAAGLPDNASLHLKLYFVLSEKSTSTGVFQKIHSTGCDFKASPLLAQITRQSLYLARGVQTENKLLLLDGSAEGSSLPSTSNIHVMARDLFSLPKSVLQLVVEPIRQVLFLHGSLAEVGKGCGILMEEIVKCQEEIFDVRDPTPWVWNWLVDVPLRQVLSNF